MAPPTPSVPETSAPTIPRAKSVSAKATVRRLALRRVVGGEVRELLVGNRLHERLQRLQRVVAGAAAIRLEQEHLRLEIRRRLAGEVGHALRGIALAGRAATQIGG